MWIRTRGGWLALAAIGGAAALYAGWLRKKPPGDQSGAVGAHARIIPLDLARQEADWTTNAVNYKGGVRGG